MSPVARGSFEALVTEAIASELADMGTAFEARTELLRPAEAPDRIALHVGRVVLRALRSVSDTERIARGVELVQNLLGPIEAAAPGAEARAEALDATARVLRAIRARLPDGSFEELAAPLTPLLDTTLLTQAPGEPSLAQQIGSEVGSADRIDVVMAFVRRTGIRPLLTALRAHLGSGRPVRVLTTTYTGTTQAEALDLLCQLGATVRVSYDTSSTRLHAKAWLFHRESGFSTAFVGSSNLTAQAQITGLEWNVRVSGARNPDVVDKFKAMFEAYWSSDEFVLYRREEFLERTAREESADGRLVLSPLEVRLEPFQERLLELLTVARDRGRHANLLVAATGTGKTVMSAVDYARLREEKPSSRLLFVAHREEILARSRDTFRHALRQPEFGELWVRDERPRRFEHVFASIQSLHERALARIDPRHFDHLVVDEAHHAAAPSYRALLEHLRPSELVGLTATPERSDGADVVSWFGGRIAAELRLWDAIDQQRLAPFLYFGIHDGMDLSEVPWRRGRGYDPVGLEKLYTANDVWARLVIQEVASHVSDPQRMRALGFCVGVAHARFMARHFEAAGIRAAAITGETAADERRAALEDLAAGRIQAVFSVDLFNEGVDIPSLDTLLFLRPTDSPVLFAQQLGRGLRKCRGKDVCTVLDFVGIHRSEFRFDRRFRAILPGRRRDLVEAVRGGFPYLPAGCHLELTPRAREIVLANLAAGAPATWKAKVEDLRALAFLKPDPTLAEFLDAGDLDVEDVYDSGRSWSELRRDAGLERSPPAAHHPALRRACGRLLHVDDRQRIDAWRAMLAADAPPDPAALPERERRLLRMLVASVAGEVLGKETSLRAGTAELWNDAVVRRELRDLLAALEARIDHVPRELVRIPGAPLCVHARYTKLEIYAALGVGDGAKVAPWMTGVRWLPEVPVDVLAFTLDKSGGGFSPTTRYRDYAISRTRIHWESQSVTRAESETGRRYREHARRGSSVLLFARLGTDDRAFWCLGPATYAGHEGERPMQILWDLEIPLPADLYASFAAAVA